MENKVPLTLSECRVIHLTPEGFFKLFFGLFSLLVLNSCSKEATLDEVHPASVETTSVLKEWATKNDKLNQANLIEWDNSIPILLSDSIKGYYAPVKTASGFKEFIIFELGGKKHGWFKTYKRLNETDMEIVIQSIEGKTLKSGVLHKSKNVLPKGKTTTMREMNFEEGPIIYNTLYDDFIFSAPRWYPPTSNYVYGSTYQFEFKAYYDSDSNLGGSGGAGSLNFDDYNNTELESKLINPCFKAVLAELKQNNVYGKISEIIQKIDFNKQGLKYSVTINENTEVVDRKLVGLNAYTVGNVITLNSSALNNASKEYIARVIIHEVLHVYINNKFGSTDHQEMLNEYVDKIATFLNKLYQTDEKDAKILSLLGLQNEEGCYPFLLKDLGISAWDVYNTDQKYKNQNYGKHCF